MAGLKRITEMIKAKNKAADRARRREINAAFQAKMGAVVKNKDRSSKVPNATLAKLQARSQGHCEARLVGCMSYSTEVHHKKLRSRGGSNNLINLLHLCHFCHSQTTDMKPGTEHLRTHSWQKEGQSEADA